MSKTGIDRDELVAMFSKASTQQGEALRKAVSSATLQALQGRELTIKNIRSVLKTVTTAASTSAAALPGADPAAIEAALGKAVAGMDTALLQAVEANRKLLQQFIEQGVELKDKRLKTAMTELEKMEDLFFTTVTKAAQGAAGPLQGPWEQVLESMKLKGTQTGMQASTAVEQLMQQTQSALRDGRAFGLRAAEALLDSYAALASGVLIGMADSLSSGGGRTSPAAGSAKPPGTATARKRPAPR